MSLFQYILNSIFFKYSILVQIDLYVSIIYSSSIPKDINLLFLSLSSFFKFKCLNISTLILSISKINGLIALHKYQIQYLELIFVLTNFEINILSTLTHKIFIGIFSA